MISSLLLSIFIYFPICLLYGFLNVSICCLCNSYIRPDLFLMCSYSCSHTVDGKQKPRVLGHNLWPWALIGPRIGGNASYQPPGAPWTLHTPEENPNTLLLETNCLYKDKRTSFSISLLIPLNGPKMGGNVIYRLQYVSIDSTRTLRSNSLTKNPPSRSTYGALRAPGGTKKG